jgi:hypothetical protein
MNRIKIQEWTRAYSKKQRDETEQKELMKILENLIVACLVKWVVRGKSRGTGGRTVRI